MRVDCDAANWRFVARIMNENSLRLTRTQSGSSDTSTSPQRQKRP
jgi:hypothetical protein